MGKTIKIKEFINKRKKLSAGIIIVVLVILAWNFLLPKQKQPQYHTSQAQKGTLVTTVSESGQITAANNVQVTIQASGVVKDVYVKNGDAVTSGQTIATLTLDQASQQKAAAAYSSYLAAQKSLADSQSKINSLQSTLFKTNQAFMTDRGVANPSDAQKADPKYIEENAEWLQAEADYKNQSIAISQAQAALNGAALTLSQTSSTITAPVAGTVKGLTITPGAIVTLSSANNSTTSTSQVLGSIYQEGPIQAQVNISEIDSVNVSEGQKVTLPLDAFPGKTFTGRVTSINTNGVVSSGVTTYPAIISFDTGNNHIYPNMSVTAKIITGIKNNVILVPSSAVQTTRGQPTVRILQNGKLMSIPVEVGDTNGTETEIVSGINVGDTVVTSVATTTTRQGSSQNSSPFGGGGFGSFRAVGGGGR